MECVAHRTGSRFLLVALLIAFTGSPAEAALTSRLQWGSFQKAAALSGTSQPVPQSDILPGVTQPQAVPTQIAPGGLTVDPEEALHPPDSEPENVTDTGLGLGTVELPPDTVGGGVVTASSAAGPTGALEIVPSGSTPPLPLTSENSSAPNLTAAPSSGPKLATTSEPIPGLATDAFKPTLAPLANEPSSSQLVQATSVPRAATILGQGKSNLPEKVQQAVEKGGDEDSEPGVYLLQATSKDTAGPNVLWVLFGVGVAGAAVAGGVYVGARLRAKRRLLGSSVWKRHGPSKEMEMEMEMMQTMKEDRTAESRTDSPL